MHQTIALLPAFLFLATLLLLDSFKLVRPATVGAAVLYGALAASACAALHEWMILQRDFVPLPVPPDAKKNAKKK